MGTTTPPSERPSVFDEWGSTGVPVTPGRLRALAVLLEDGASRYERLSAKPAQGRGGPERSLPVSWSQAQANLLSWADALESGTLQPARSAPGRTLGLMTPGTLYDVAVLLALGESAAVVDAAIDGAVYVADYTVRDTVMEWARTLQHGILDVDVDSEADVREWASYVTRMVQSAREAGGGLEL